MATHEREDLALRVVEGELACCGFLGFVILVGARRFCGGLLGSGRRPFPKAGAHVIMHEKVAAAQEKGVDQNVSEFVC